jgi:hypothetical protein
LKKKLVRQPFERTGGPDWGFSALFGMIHPQFHRRFVIESFGEVPPTVSILTLLPNESAF